MPGNWNEIETLEAFDTPLWTERLRHLPLETLGQIIAENRHIHCLERVQALCHKLNEVFIEKGELINLMACCSVAQLPLLMFGPWGTAKSMLVRQFALGLGIRPRELPIDDEDRVLAELDQLTIQRKAGGSAGRAVDILRDRFGKRSDSSRFFEYLVTPFTTPDELLGPVNVPAMLDHSLHLRQTLGLLPRAEIVFLDEVFRANSAILNALLSVLNERIFHNGGVPWSVNLVMLFGASNGPPVDPELGAVFDRFPIRILSESVSDSGLSALLERSHAQRFLSHLGNSPHVQAAGQVPGAVLGLAPVTQVASVNDFRLLHKASLYLFSGAATRGQADGNDPFLKVFLPLFGLLRDQFEVSDRSCAHFYQLARARALLQLGVDRKVTHPQLLPRDCEVLQYCGKDFETAPAT